MFRQKVICDLDLLIHLCFNFPSCYWKLPDVSALLNVNFSNLGVQRDRNSRTTEQCEFETFCYPKR